MVIRCPYPDIDIPEVDILTHLFDSGESLSDDPLWINAADTSQYLSPRTALQWIKRLAIGLDRLGIGRSEVVMIVTPNHIFVPVAYLGVVGSCRVFSGANPAYSADGKYDFNLPIHCMNTRGLLLMGLFCTCRPSTNHYIGC